MCPVDSGTTGSGSDQASFLDPTMAVHGGKDSLALAVRDHDSNRAAVISSPKDRRLRKLLQMIEQEPTGSIHDWALALSLSDSHLRHLFKQATGLSLGYVVTERRLLRAAELLTHSNLSIKEIASAVGYQHTSSFTRAFARRFEQAPHIYRQENGYL